MSTERAQAYTESGVNIEAGNALVSKIKDLVKATQTKGVLSDIGGFGGLFRPDITGMSTPVLVSSTDGVGTKLKLAFQYNKHDTVGIDLVAMSVNDILVQGATPLFFLDYFATGKLDVEVARTVVAGVAEGCKQSACALLGGETAEMPDMYGEGEYDLAGFCVGIVDNSKLIDGSTIRVGDVMTNRKVVLYIDGEPVLKKKRRVMAPGEMEELVLTKKALSAHTDIKSIEIKVEEDA